MKGICESADKHKLIWDHEDLVCSRCGFVDRDATEAVMTSTREAIVQNHATVNHLMLVKLGSSHDYVSPSNKGLTFDINNQRGKDFEGKKITPLLSDSYNTGQLVEKGSIPYTEYDLYERWKEANPAIASLVSFETYQKLPENPEHELHHMEQDGKIRIRKPITADQIFNSLLIQMRTFAIECNFHPTGVEFEALEKAGVKTWQQYWQLFAKMMLHVITSKLIDEQPGAKIIVSEKMRNEFYKVLEELKSALLTTRDIYENYNVLAIHAR